MIKMNWNIDERNTNVSKYLVDPQSDKESRRKAFLGGWTRYLNNESSDSLDAVSWVGLGMWCASILGDIPEKQRKDIYLILLGQYVGSDRVKHWTDEQREEVLRLAGERKPISPFCIYTIRSRRDLDETYLRNGKGEFTENKTWKTGWKLFQEAKRSGQRMPVIFASAEVTDKLIYYALLNDIEIDETNYTTRYEFTQLEKVKGDLPLSTLRLRSTNQPLSENYIRPYAICLTPSFIR